MQGHSQDGIAWLKGTEDGWIGCNNFTYHVWWHRALFHYERAQYDEVMRLYDAHIRADQSDDYLDISNAVATLWRLENAGVATGGRWDELADKAEARTGDHLLAFADMHFAIALAAAGRAFALDDMVASMRTANSASRTTQQQVLAEVGMALAQAVRAQYHGDFDLAVSLMLPLRYRIRAIGGSHAQRDLFAQMLIKAALKCDKYPLARALLHERTASKPNNAQAWTLLATALEGEGKITDAAVARRRAEQLLTA